MKAARPATSVLEVFIAPMPAKLLPHLLLSALLLASSSLSAEATSVRRGLFSQQSHPVSSTRQLKAKGAGGEVADLMIQTAQAISTTIQADKATRQQFAGKTVADLSAKKPNYRYVAACTCQPHTMTGAFVHQHVECYYTLGTSQGYDIYAVKNGDKATFTLTGDGGDINWGFIGTKIKRSGKTLQFS